MVTNAETTAELKPGRFYHLVPKSPLANLRFRRRILRDAAEDPAVARALWLMCQEDLLFYINVFCWAHNSKDYLNSPHRPFITWALQDHALLELQAAVGHHDIALPKSRQMGATLMCVTVFEHRWHFWPGQTFLMCSRKEELVDKTGSPKALFWKLDYLHKHQPRWILPVGRHLAEKDPNRTKMHLQNADNGSVIDGEATVPDLGRGDVLTAIFLDEAAFMEKAAAIAKSTRDATHCRILNSTYNGTVGIGAEFYRSCVNDCWKVVKLYWPEHPKKREGFYESHDGVLEILDRDYAFPSEYPFILDGKRRSVWYDYQCGRANSEREIAEEIDMDPWGSLEQFFHGPLVKAHREEYQEQPFYCGSIDRDKETGRPVFVEKDDGLLKLWVGLHPRTNQPLVDQVVIANDIAAGVGGDHSSNSALCAIDKRTGRVIITYASDKIMPVDFADMTILVAQWCKDALINWDNIGGLGRQFQNELVRQNYPYLYRRDIDDKGFSEKTQKLGWVSNDGPQKILGELQRAMQAGEIKIPDEEMLDELMQFVYKGGKVVHDATLATQDESGKGRAHGDRGIAVALAWLAMHDSPVEDDKPTDEGYPPGSLGWHMDQQDRETTGRKSRATQLVFG